MAWVGRSKVLTQNGYGAARVPWKNKRKNEKFYPGELRRNSAQRTRQDNLPLVSTTNYHWWVIRSKTLVMWQQVHCRRMYDIRVTWMVEKSRRTEAITSRFRGQISQVLTIPITTFARNYSHTPYYWSAKIFGTGGGGIFAHSSKRNLRTQATLWWSTSRKNVNA